MVNPAATKHMMRAYLFMTLIPFAIDYVPDEMTASTLPARLSSCIPVMLRGTLPRKDFSALAGLAIEHDDLRQHARLRDRFDKFHAPIAVAAKLVWSVGITGHERSLGHPM